MPRILISFFAICLLLLSACSTFNETGYDRTPASDLLSYEELMTVKSGTYKRTGDRLIPHLAGQHAYYFKGVELEFIEDPKMPGENAFKISPTVENNKYKIKIYHAIGAAEDNDALIELDKILSALSKNMGSPFAIMELDYNARNGHIPSLHSLSRLRKDLSVPGIYYSATYFDSADYDNRTAEKTKIWNDNFEAYEKALRADNKKTKTLENTRRALMDKLDKAPEHEQFRSMVASNDRKGVAKLLHSYLPWELMAPFEKKFWDNHLSIMVDPLPLEERILIYRGIDDDLVQLPIVDGKMLSKEEAFKEQNIFLMSTIMTKNQGSWNRRLRSLTAMYEKYIGIDSNQTSQSTRAYRITTMFANHSSDPKGSPYLSLTPKFYTAQGFGTSRMTALLVDPRSIYFNYASRYESEKEFLAPLVTFPDELGSVYDRTTHGHKEVEQFFNESIKARLVQKFGQAEGEKAYEKIIARSASFFAPIKGSPGALESSSDFFKKTLGMETAKVVKEINSQTDLPCMDLVQLFWK